MKKRKAFFKLLVPVLLIAACSLLFFMSCEESEDEPGEKPENGSKYDLPDVLTMLDGTKVTTPALWAERREEIKKILQDNAYGMWRDGTGEELTYTISENTLSITITVGDETASFNASFTLPTGTPPAGGWPVIIGIGGVDGTDFLAGSPGNPRQYALDKGYAIINSPTGSVASDNNSRTGVFYDLYPYGSTVETRTGVLMAWAWATSKILDALEAGAGDELKINTTITMVTGTSRNGKAAAVAGAFEERFKVTSPNSSGAGGLAIGRYDSAGQTYSLSSYFSYNGGGSWSVDGNNPQSYMSIRGDSGGGWFVHRFQTFSSYQALPFDQHFLAALCAAPDRYLFMVNGFEWDKWTNVPGFFWCFEETKPVFDLLGVPNNIMVSMHRERHGMEQEDMVKLLNFIDYKYYDKPLNFDGFPSGKPKPANWDEFLTSLHRTPFSYEVSPSNNATYEEGKPRITD